MFVAVRLNFFFNLNRKYDPLVQNSASVYNYLRKLFLSILLNIYIYIYPLTLHLQPCLHTEYEGIGMSTKGLRQECSWQQYLQLPKIGHMGLSELNLAQDSVWKHFLIVGLSLHLGSPPGRLVGAG